MTRGAEVKLVFFSNYICFTKTVRFILQVRTSCIITAIMSV